MKFSFIRGELVVAIAVVCSGCTAWDSLIGQRARPADVDETAAAGSMSFERNACGDVVAVCCQTACTKAEKASELEREFKEMLERAVPDRRTRREIGTQVVFVRKHVKPCNASSAITFSIRMPDGSTPSSQTIELEVLKSSTPHPDRDGLAEVFAKWKESAGSGSGAKLVITIKVCPSGGSAQSVASTCGEPDISPVRTAGIGEPGGHTASSTTTTDSRQCDATAVCTPCTIPPSIDREYKLNWDGII